MTNRSSLTRFTHFSLLPSLNCLSPLTVFVVRALGHEVVVNEKCFGELPCDPQGGSNEMGEILCLVSFLLVGHCVRDRVCVCEGEGEREREKERDSTHESHLQSSVHYYVHCYCNSQLQR